MDEIAVLGEHGYLIGSISAKQMHLMASGHRFYELATNSVRHFLEAVEAEAALEENVNTKFSHREGPLTTICRPSNSLHSVVERMVLAHHHQAYLLDENEELPKRIISAHDIIAVFALVSCAPVCVCVCV